MSVKILGFLQEIYNIVTFLQTLVMEEELFIILVLLDYRLHSLGEIPKVLEIKCRWKRPHTFLPSTAGNLAQNDAL